MALITKIVGGSEDATPTSEFSMPDGYEAAKIGTAASVSENAQLQPFITSVMYGVCDGEERKARPVTLQAHFMHPEKGGHYLAGYCHLSEAFVTLPITPSTALLNLRSGELHADPIAHLTHCYVAEHDSQDNTTATFKTIISHYKQELDILVFMGWADGQFDESEKLVALQFLKAAYAQPTHLLAEQLAHQATEMTDALVGLFVQHIHKLSPNAHDFTAAVNAISTDKDRSDLLSSFLGRMMLADGVASPEEMELLKVLKPIG